MNFFKKVFQTVVPSPEDDEEILEEEQLDQHKELPREKEVQEQPHEQDKPRQEERLFRDKRGERGGRTLKLPVNDSKAGATIFHPTVFDDCRTIADYLKANKMVIVNFEKTDNLLAKRMTDFISGTIYAVGGSLRKIGQKILLCAPKNFDIDSEASNYVGKGEKPWKD